MAQNKNIGTELMLQMLKLSGAVQEAKNLKPVMAANFDALEEGIDRTEVILNKVTDPELREIAKAGSQSLLINLFSKGT